MSEIQQPMMVELVPGVWVRPEQVAAFWKTARSLAVQFVGAEVQYFYATDDNELPSVAEILDRLNPIRWEQPDPPPVSDPPPVGLSSRMTGVVMYADSSATGNDDIDPSGRSYQCNIYCYGTREHHEKHRPTGNEMTDDMEQR